MRRAPLRRAPIVLFAAAAGVIGGVALRPGAQIASNAAGRPDREPVTRPVRVGGRVTAQGDTVETPYGPVQVSVKLRRGRLIDVDARQLPDDEAFSVQISQAVAPVLRGEALAAQSADVDVVSGATYTSDGYRESLQAALDRAG